MNSRLSEARPYLVCLLLVAGILACYWQVSDHEFVNYDDDRYVTENRHVQAGLGREGIVWAFGTNITGNWHPLTWLSHMLDCTLFGLDSGWHHRINVVFHVINTLLLFLVLRQMTGALWRSGFAAALFALHPLHVESVAWVAERKDLLSTFFWMLTMWSYVWYVEHPGTKRYLLVMMFFILGLMAKPMVVTLPFVLLLMDYWPLGRFQWGQVDEERKVTSKRQSASRLVWEKVPLFVCTVASSIVTFLAQKAGGAVSSLEVFSLDVRVGNALVSYAKYIGKMLWPQDLAVLYPHPATLPMWQGVGAGILLVFLSALVVRAGRRHPFLAVGWFWYLGTLVPVIGLVQVGLQALADRYTYVPLVGLFIIISWGAHYLQAGWKSRWLALALLAAVVLSALMICTGLQLRHWSNSITLFKHAISVTTDNWVARNNLGEGLERQGRLQEAVSHYNEALRIKPGFAKAHNNLGNALLSQGKAQEAVSHYNEALRMKPDYAKAHYNLGTALLGQGRAEEAARHYEAALRINPDYYEAHYNLGLALARQGRVGEAIEHFSETLRLMPGFAEAHYNLGNALLRQGIVKEAIYHYSEALRIKPDFAEAHYQLGTVFLRQAELTKAIKHYREAVLIKPDYLEAHNNLGNALLSQGNINEAVHYYSEVLRLRPEYVEAHNNLGIILARQGKLDGAIRHFSEAVLVKPDFAEGHYNLGNALLHQGKSEDAAHHFSEALRIKPEHRKAREKLDALLGKVGKTEETPNSMVDAKQ